CQQLACCCFCRMSWALRSWPPSWWRSSTLWCSSVSNRIIPVLAPPKAREILRAKSTSSRPPRTRVVTKEAAVATMNARSCTQVQCNVRPDYESGGRRFESFRARQYLAENAIVNLRLRVRQGYAEDGHTSTCACPVQLPRTQMQFVSWFPPLA